MKDDLTTRSTKILLIEDHPAHVVRIRSAFEKDGSDRYSIAVAKQLCEGLELVASNSADIILLDLGLPDSQGTDSYLRLHNYAPELPIVVLGEDSDSSLAQLLLQQGAQDFILKSKLDPETLPTTVNNAIRRHKVLVELDTARSAVVAATRAKRHFLANMSHEIRTPITGILGAVDLFPGTNLTNEQREYLSIIRFSGDFLLNVINDILDFSKIEEGVIDFNAVEFSVVEYAKQLLAAFSLKAKSAQIILESRLDPKLPELAVGDVDRLGQILSNLISNAIKFTPPGGTVCVEIKVRHADEERIQLDFGVRDSGIGIAEEKQAKIFEPFGQAHEQREQKRYSGTGLGLSICQSLVRAMGGRIWLESTLGTGSTFHFTLPLRTRSEIAQVKTPISAVDGDNLSEHWAHLSRPIALNILVVEDNAINQLVAKRLLERQGHLVTVVSDGKQALSAVSAHEFDLIFMDCQMPIMDGFSATREIRSNETNSTKHIPIVAMTADVSEHAKSRCLQAGMDEYISKPINRNTLETLLRRVAGKHLTA